MKNIIIGIVASLFMVVFFVVMGMTMIQEEKNWNNYVAQFHCKKAGYIDGSVGTGIAPVVGSSGNGGVAVATVVTPKKTRWLCDNGEEIFK